MERTELARGMINGHDELIISLIQPEHEPAVIIFRWPPKPTVAAEAALNRTVANVMTVAAQARVRLSQIRADGLR
jgi:hypothetical protein